MLSSYVYRYRTAGDVITREAYFDITLEVVFSCLPFFHHIAIRPSYMLPFDDAKSVSGVFNQRRAYVARVHYARVTADLQGALISAFERVLGDVTVSMSQCWLHCSRKASAKLGLKEAVRNQGHVFWDSCCC